MRRMRHLKPREIQGCQLALDASISTSLYDATSGGSLVAANGAVARWEDQSGNGNHVTQATSGLRPLRRIAARGGVDALQTSSDANSTMQSASLYPSSGASDVTIVSVTLPITSGRSGAWAYGNYTSGRHLFYCPRQSATESRVECGNGSVYIGRSGSPIEIGSWHCHTAYHAGSTTIGGLRQRVNGNATVSDSTQGASTSLNIGTGDPFRVSVATVKISYMAFFATYSRALNPQVMMRLENAQMRKWSIPG